MADFAQLGPLTGESSDDGEGAEIEARAQAEEAAARALESEVARVKAEADARLSEELFWLAQKLWVRSAASGSGTLVTVVMKVALGLVPSRLARPIVSVALLVQ